MTKAGKAASARQLARDLEAANQRAQRFADLCLVLASREVRAQGRCLLLETEIEGAQAAYQGMQVKVCERGLIIELFDRAQAEPTANVVAPPGSEEPRRIIH